MPCTVGRQPVPAVSWSRRSVGSALSQIWRSDQTIDRRNCGGIARVTGTEGVKMVSTEKPDSFDTGESRIGDKNRMARL